MIFLLFLAAVSVYFVVFRCSDFYVPSCLLGTACARVV